jgi:hypothetical protein
MALTYEDVKTQFESGGYLIVDHTRGKLGVYGSAYVVECLKCKTQKTTEWQYRTRRCMKCYFQKKKDDLWVKLQKIAEQLSLKILTPREQFLTERDILELLCSNNHITKTTGVRLKKAKGCSYCNKTNRHVHTAHNLPLVLSERGWEYVSGEYKNKKSVITAKCPSGHLNSKAFTSFSDGCIHCQRANMKRSQFKELKNSILEEGYVVLEEVDQNTFKYETKFKIKCPKCSEEFFTSCRAFWSDESRCPQCSLSKNTSDGETEIEGWLNSLGYKTKKVKYKDIGEIDIFLEDQRVGIEFNGLYFHSSAHVDKNYHLRKYTHAQNLNIRLFQFWEDEWYATPNIVKSILLNALKHTSLITKIYAKDCEIVRPKKETVESFLNTNHLMGWAPSSASLALFYNNEPVQMITLAKHHRTNNEIVISRLCSKMNTVIVGGFSRLLSRCPRPLTTWSDNRFSNGHVYEKIGFIKDGELEPDYQYVRSGRRYTKQSLKKTLEERLSGKAELDLRLDQGYYRLYDAGKARWKLLGS